MKLLILLPENKNKEENIANNPKLTYNKEVWIIKKF